jgi:hypothetical protein
MATGLAVVVLWAASGTQRERPLLTGDMPDVVREREASAAARPEDGDAQRALAQAYLDASQPGLAVRALETAPPAVRNDARTRHLYARALLDQGRNDDALAVETTVVTSCMPAIDGVPDTIKPDHKATGCDALLLGGALRRAAILKELVAMGVEDTRAYPEASFVAYQNATREARVKAF